MNKIIFSNSSHMQIQGRDVLGLIDYSDNCAEYYLNRFKKIVRLVDYREAGLQALRQVLETGKKEDFPYQFNLPSFITIKVLDQQRITIELEDTNDQNPKYMLWIAIGFKGSIPTYNYIYKETIKLGIDNTYALLSLYERPKRHRKIHPIYSNLFRY